MTDSSSAGRWLEKTWYSRLEASSPAAEIGYSNGLEREWPGAGMAARDIPPFKVGANDKWHRWSDGKLGRISRATDVQN
jgi:hypothetical protein